MMDVKAANPRGEFCTAPAPEGPESALDFVVLVIAVSLNPSSKPTICLVLLVVPRARAQSASMPMTISTVWYATSRRLQKCTRRRKNPSCMRRGSGIKGKRRTQEGLYARVRESERERERGRAEHSRQSTHRMGGQASRIKRRKREPRRLRTEAQPVTHVMMTRHLYSATQNGTRRKLARLKVRMLRGIARER